MRKIKLLLALAFHGFCWTAFSQQLPIFTQYREYQSYINPASLNSDFFLYDYNVSVGTSFRTQWVGEEGTPKTGLLSAEFIYDESLVGFISGLNIVYDATNPFSNTGIYGRIGGLLRLSDYNGLSLGLTLGAVQYRFNALDLPREVRINDPLLQQNYTSWNPDVGAGAFFFQEMRRGAFDGDVFYAGISVPQVLGLTYELENSTGQTLISRRIPHFFGTVGYYKFLANDSFLEFSSWLKYLTYRPSVLHADFNVRAQLINILWMGIGVSTTGNVHLEAGFLVGENLDLDGTFRIGYGFDYPFTTFGPRFGASHEINLRYIFEY